MKPSRFLVALLATAFAQEKAKGEKPAAPDAAVLAIVELSASYMFESHQKIGHVVDAYAAKTIDLAAASMDLGVTRGLLQLIETKLADLVASVKFSDNNAKQFADVRKVLAIEIKAIDSILAYWKEGNADDEKTYAKHRMEAWKNIVTQLDLGRSEKKAMQGTWSATKAAKNGEDLAAEDLKLMKIDIKDDVITVAMGSESNSVSFVLNRIASPNQLDAFILDGPAKGKTRLGIFEIRDDVLKICWSSGEKRPKKFNGDQGELVSYFELKRVKE